MFVYVAFVIDAYAGAIVGREASASKHTRVCGIRQAAALRSRQGHPIEDAIHHSDAGPQGGFNLSSQHRVVDLTVVGRQALPSVSSSRVSCGVGC